MKDKVLLNVLLPATGRRYEFRVPYDMTVEDAARMISELLASREREVYEANPQADLAIIDPASNAAGDMLSPCDLIRALVENDVLVDGTLAAVV